MPPVQVQHRSTASRASSAFDPWQPPQGAPTVATGTPPASPVGSVAAPPAAKVDESTNGVRLAAAAVDEAGAVRVAAKEAAGAGAARLASECAFEADAARLATIADARVDVARDALVGSQSAPDRLVVVACPAADAGTTVPAPGEDARGSTCPGISKSPEELLRSKSSGPNEKLGWQQSKPEVRTTTLRPGTWWRCLLKPRLGSTMATI